MRVSTFLIIPLCLFGMFLGGCNAAKQEPRPAPPQLTRQKQEKQAAARRERVQQAISADFGLPLWVEEKLRKPEPVAVVPEPKPAISPVPPPTLPSVIPARSVMVVGDSFAVGVGMTMSNELKGMGVSLQQRGKTSSGLNSPAFYNWQQQLSSFIQQDRPEVIVAMISGNDAHNGSGSDSWRQAYVQKARDFANIAVNSGVTLYFVGLPPMGKNGYSERANQANQALRDACSGVPGCHYVDAWSLFSGDDGQFTRHKNFNGKVLTLRAKDGVHFTMTGYRLLSRHILDEIANTYQQ